MESEARLELQHWQQCCSKLCWSSVDSCNTQAKATTPPATPATAGAGEAKLLRGRWLWWGLGTPQPCSETRQCICKREQRQQRLRQGGRDRGRQGQGRRPLTHQQPLIPGRKVMWQWVAMLVLLFR